MGIEVKCTDCNKPFNVPRYTALDFALCRGCMLEKLKGDSNERQH